MPYAEPESIHALLLLHGDNECMQRNEPCLFVTDYQTYLDAVWTAIHARVGKRDDTQDNEGSLGPPTYTEDNK